MRLLKKTSTAGLVLLILGICCVSHTASATECWVGTWASGQQLTETQNNPPSPGLSNNTLRQVVHVSLGGSRLRVQFSNKYGSSAVTINEAHIAVSAGESAIDTETDSALTFGGSSSVTINAGQEVYSDALDFNVAPLSDLTVSIYFGATSSNVTGHPGSRATSYIQSGNVVTAPDMASAVTTNHWYILSRIDLWLDDSYACVVTLGDSITDGNGSTTNGNNRWPDDLARRLQADPNTAKIGVINQGIGGNAVVSGGLGPTALVRFDHDVLGQPGVRWLIILEGVNDIGNSSPQVVTNLIAAYEQFIDKAHAHNIPVFGVPILPFGGSFYDSTSHQAHRQSVNDWIRTSGKFDAVIDLDAAVRDPSNPNKLLWAYDSGDRLHPSVAGYQKMADAIDFYLFNLPEYERPWTIFVDDDAPPGGDGSSWDKAYRYLQYASHVAGDGDQVFVAEGIYKPDRGGGLNPSDRYATFQIISGGAIYGGYAGFGTPDPNKRDIELYKTILSGDLLGNDDPNTPTEDLVDAPCRMDNCYHVVTGSCTDATTILDGFTITGGNGRDIGLGGGMYNYESSLTVTNCTFNRNSGYLGGGMCNEYYSSPTITNCTFSENLATFGGGGMYNKLSEPNITNCTFSGNSANTWGGGMCNEYYSSPTITNCTFSGNSIIGDLIFEGYGGGIYNYYSGATLTNCILYGNTGLDGNEIALSEDSTIYIYYCDVKGDQTEVYLEQGCELNWRVGNIDADPCFVEAGYWDANGTPDDMNDDFWVDGDYHLKSAGWRWDTQRQLWTWDEVTSRCIDAGNPGSPLGQEPLTVPDDPNNIWGINQRINMGAYGGTAEASIPPYDWAFLSDITNDGTTDFADYSFLAELFAQNGENLFADFNRDGTVDLFDLNLLVNDWLMTTSWK